MPYKDPHAYKDKARKAVRDAVKSGKLLKPNVCSVCEKPSKIIHGHHPNYDKPLAVIWVCPGCHSAIHHPFPLKNLFGLKRSIVMIEQEYLG